MKQGRWLIYLLVALIPHLWTANRVSIYKLATLPDMVQGTASNPHVRRALASDVIRIVSTLVPAPARSAIDAFAASPSPIARWLRWDPAHGVWFAVTFVLLWGSLVAFAFGLERLIRLAYDVGHGWAVAGAGLGLATLFIHFGFQNYTYDFPGLALFTWAFVFLIEGRWPAYLVTLALAALNKESALFLLPASLALRSARGDRRDLLVRFVAEAGVVLAALAVQFARFHDLPGEAMQFTLWINLASPVKPKEWIHHLLYVGFLVFALWGGWPARLLREPALVLLALLGGSMLVVGKLGEYRVFYEFYPLLCAMALGGLMRLAGRTPAPRAAA